MADGQKDLGISTTATKPLTRAAGSSHDRRIAVRAAKRNRGTGVQLPFDFGSAAGEVKTAKFPGSPAPPAAPAAPRSALTALNLNSPKSLRYLTHAGGGRLNRGS